MTVSYLHILILSATLFLFWLTRENRLAVFFVGTLSVIFLSFRDRATDLFRYKAWFESIAENGLNFSISSIVETDFGFEVLMWLVYYGGFEFQHFQLLVAFLGIFLKFKAFQKFLKTASIYAVIWYLSRHFYHHEWTAFRFALAGSIIIFNFLHFKSNLSKFLALLFAISIHAGASLLLLPWILSKLDIKKNILILASGLIIFCLSINIFISFISSLESMRFSMFLKETGPHLNYGSVILILLNFLLIGMCLITQKSIGSDLNFFLMCLFCGVAFRLALIEYSQFGSRIGAVFDLAQPFVFGTLINRIRPKGLRGMFFLLPIFCYWAEFKM